jgi:hypothetical protein
MFYQLLVYTDDVNLLRDKIDSIKGNTNCDASKEVGPEVITEKTKYMCMTCHQNSGQNHDIKTANRSF